MLGIKVKLQVGSLVEHNDFFFGALPKEGTNKLECELKHGVCIENVEYSKPFGVEVLKHAGQALDRAQRLLVEIALRNSLHIQENAALLRTALVRSI